MEDDAGFWNAQAASFDDEPDHGLRDPRVRAVWAKLLRGLPPAPPARVADLGCGTGTLSVLSAQQGHRVTGVDLAPNMIRLARRKAQAAGVEVALVVGDASAPPLAAGGWDVVLARHVLWALPDAAAGLGRWIELLAPHGRLVLIEGRWSTGAGLPAGAARRLLEAHGRRASVIRLTDPAYWGREIDDERYAIVSPPPGPDDRSGAIVASEPRRQGVAKSDAGLSLTQASHHPA